MFTIEAGSVDEAYVKGLRLLVDHGRQQDTRAGTAWALDTPLAVTYTQPQNRVLMNPERDANPFFHLFEALWLLAGRNDAKWLDQFVHDFSSRFAEEGGRLHGSYGYRWRNHFDVDGGGNANMPDQLDTVVRLLKENPQDRRVVIQMWDAPSDLGQSFNDVPCNLMALPRLRVGAVKDEWGFAMDDRHLLLDLTVYNRSNDLYWGMFGANAVQFSMLQEYLAGRIGVGVGKYVQISNNAHLYGVHVEKAIASALPKFQIKEPDRVVPIGKNWDVWDRDLGRFMEWTEYGWNPYDSAKVIENPWFNETAIPLYHAHQLWKSGQREQACAALYEGHVIETMAPDWREAALKWMGRRLDRGTEAGE